MLSLCLHEFEVKGILAETITELWRPVKPQPRETSEWLDVDSRCNFDWNSCYCGIDYIKSKSPFGPIGTRITGKEIWVIDCSTPTIPIYLYKADDGFYPDGGWKSPVIMPIEASRLTLINVGVICKQVREITEDEAIKAGSQTPIINFSGSQAVWSERQAWKNIWDSLYSQKGYPFEIAWAWKLKFESEVKR